MKENADRNFVWRNLAVSCGPVRSARSRRERTPGQLRLHGRSGNSSIRPTATSRCRMIHRYTNASAFAPIPFTEIGLYPRRLSCHVARATPHYAALREVRHDNLHSGPRETHATDSPDTGNTCTWQQAVLDCALQPSVFCACRLTLLWNFFFRGAQLMRSENQSPTENTRRTFLKSTGAMAAGLVLTSTANAEGSALAVTAARKP